MLERDQRARFSAAQCLEHDWLRSDNAPGSPPATPISPRIASDLGKWKQQVAKRRVKALGIAMMASKSFRAAGSKKGFSQGSTEEIALAARTWNAFEEKAAVRIQSEARRFLADKEVRALKASRAASDKWAAAAAAERENRATHGGGDSPPIPPRAGGGGGGFAAAAQAETAI